MKMKTRLSLSALILTVPALFPFLARAADTPSVKDPKPFKMAVPLPKGFFELKRSEGDLNGDGVFDYAVTAATCPDEKACGELKEDAKREIQLFIFLGNKEAGPKLVATASKALCFDCMGMVGGLIGGDVAIAPKEVLTISYDGGSRERYSQQLKWRKTKASVDQPVVFELIGSTYSSLDTMDANEEEGEAIDDGQGNLIDINYSTRKVHVKKTGEKGKNGKRKKFEKNCALPKDFKTPKFEDYAFGEFKDGSEGCK